MTPYDARYELMDREYPDFQMLSSGRRKARKRHVCSFCKQAIEPGQTYEYTVYVEDGKFKTDSQHSPCPEYLAILAGEEVSLSTPASI